MLRRLVLLAFVVGLALSGPAPFVARLLAAAFSDTFDRADSDSLGANWTEAAGDADIASNQFRLGTGSFGVVTAIYSGTAAASADQYAMVTLGPNNAYPWIVFRYTNSGSPYYAFQIDGTNGTVEWYRFDNAADTAGTEIGTDVDTGGDMTGVAVAITITGTGANTDVRIWRTPGGLPSAADNWNGDTSPDATWLTTDPGGSAINTGTFIGIGGQAGVADSVTINDFFGGDFGGAPPPVITRGPLLGVLP